MSEEELIKETMMLDYSQLVMNNVYCHKEIERLNKRIEDLNIINEEHKILNGMIRKELQQKELQQKELIKIKKVFNKIIKYHEKNKILIDKIEKEINHC